MGLKEYWETLTPQQKTKLRPYIIAEIAWIGDALKRESNFYRWPKGMKNHKSGVLV